jgi:predicted nuclease of predicted toxin-antitoxin system
MRFMVDESTGAAVVEYLRRNGHDALAVAEAMPQADDQDIIARAASEERVLITNDKDFGELVFRSGWAHHGVLLLRLHDESPSSRLNVIKSVLEHYADRLTGQFVVAAEDSVRVRYTGR